MSTTHRIEIACDTPEAEQFAAYLTAQGHDAKVGRTTGDYIDGAWTSHNEEASDTMRALWTAYCNA